MEDQHHKKNCEGPSVSHIKERMVPEIGHWPIKALDSRGEHWENTPGSPP